MRALVTFTGASGPFTHNWKFGWLSNWTNHSSSKIRKTRTQAKASKGASHVAAFRKTWDFWFLWLLRIGPTVSDLPNLPNLPFFLDLPPQTHEAMLPANCSFSLQKAPPRFLPSSVIRNHHLASTLEAKKKTTFVSHRKTIRENAGHSR